MFRTMETAFSFQEHISAGQNTNFKVRNLLPEYAVLQMVKSLMK